MKGLIAAGCINPELVTLKAELPAHMKGLLAAGCINPELVTLKAELPAHMKGLLSAGCINPKLVALKAELPAQKFLRRTAVIDILPHSFSNCKQKMKVFSSGGVSGRSGAEIL